MMKMFYMCTAQYSHVWSLGTWDVASVTKELDFLLYFPLINLSVSSHVELVAMVLDSSSLEHGSELGRLWQASHGIYLPWAFLPSGLKIITAPGSWDLFES